MNTKRVISIIVVAIIIGGGAGLYYYARSQSTSNTNEITSNEPEVNDNTNVADDTANTEAVPSTQLTGPMLELAKSRDARRLSDIRTIANALESYKNAQGNYPAELSSLVSAYLPNIPENPTPGGLTYDYTPIGSEPYSYYSLYYNLEAGSDDVSAGDHEATPDGIASF